VWLQWGGGNTRLERKVGCESLNGQLMAQDFFFFKQPLQAMKNFKPRSYTVGYNFKNISGSSVEN